MSSQSIRNIAILCILASFTLGAVKPPLYPRIIVCDDAPDWVKPSLPVALKLWERLGYQTPAVESRTCEQTCQDEKGTIHTCSPNEVIITLASVSTPPNASGGCRTFEKVPGGSIELTWEEPSHSEVVLAHEIGHCIYDLRHSAHTSCARAAPGEDYIMSKRTEWSDPPKDEPEWWMGR